MSCCPPWFSTGALQVGDCIVMVPQFWIFGCFEAFGLSFFSQLLLQEQCPVGSNECSPASAAKARRG